MEFRSVPMACHFYLQDHQGSVRMVVNAATDSVEQVTHYYPYGGLMADISTGQNLQPYKYGGKELDRFGGLDLYDFGARQMDPLLPGFTSTDPLAEKYYAISPYAYCAGDPVNAVDPDGRSTWVINEGDGLFRIIGGDLTDNDLSIYVGYFNGSKFCRLFPLGITTTLTSFYNSDKNGGKNRGTVL